jgi:hypothetical protein
MFYIQILSAIAFSVCVYEGLEIIVKLSDLAFCKNPIDLSTVVFLFSVSLGALYYINSFLL